MYSCFLFYRIVAIHHSRKRDGGALEYLGYFNPMVRPNEVSLNAGQIKYWLGVGAQPTFPVKKLLVKASILKEELPHKITPKKKKAMRKRKLD